MPTHARFLRQTFAALAVATACAALSALPAKAGGHLADTARTAIAAFVEGVISGPDAVAPLLAHEYQIMRSNGVGYDRAGYIGRGAGSVNARPKYALADIVATEDGGVLVTRYTLEIEETIDGKPVTRRAPRLTVFRKIGGEWRVSAHANFAQVD
jgi:hypothetical protein